MNEDEYIKIDNTNNICKTRTRIHSVRFAYNILDIKDMFNVFIFDMRGVLHSGGAVSNKKLEMLKELRQNGKKIIIASNNTSFSSEYINKVRKKGLEKNVHFDFTVTAGDVLKSMVKNGEIEKIVNKEKIRIFTLDYVKKCICDLFFKDNATKFIKAANIYMADLVLTGTPVVDEHRISTTEKNEYKAKRKNIMDVIKSRNMPVLVPNPDTKLPYQDGVQAIGAGKFGKMCKKNGIKVIDVGKPSEYFYNYIKEKLKMYNIKEHNSKIVVIGDTISTDIVGGNKAGFSTVAIVNKRSNMGLSFQKNSKKFINKIHSKETQPTIIITKIV